MAAYVVRADIRNARAKRFAFRAYKTMYAGRRIARGDTVYVFANERVGAGLIARGIVSSARAVPKVPGVVRQTPRVSITVERTALARRTFGRDAVKGFTRWADGRPQTELNFKFFRQATDKIGSVTDATAAFLNRHF